MLLSIIIPVYNVEKYVEKCIRSCETQDIPSSEYELICINDGSKDNSLAIVEGLAREFDNIKIINQENQGLSMARNNGLKIATGDYIWFVDSDDWIADNCLAALTKTLVSEKLDALIINGIRFIDGVEMLHQNIDVTPIMSGIEMMRHHHINCASVKTILKRSLFEDHNISFYPGIYHEDQEYSPRIYFYIERIRQSDFFIYMNRLNRQSITQTVNPKKGFDLLRVAESLHKFCEEYVQEKDKYIYHDFICSNLNQSLSNIIIAPNDVKREYKARLKDFKHLFNSYLKSSLLQYRFEGVLFKFGLSPLFVYKFIRSAKSH